MCVIHFKHATIRNVYYTNNDVNRFRTFCRQDFDGGMAFESLPLAGTYGSNSHMLTDIP